MSTQEYKKLSYNQASDSVNFLRGKILTIIDATFPENLNDKRKAIKDLIHSAFGETINVFWRHTIGQDVYPPETEKEKDIISR